MNLLSEMEDEIVTAVQVGGFRLQGERSVALTPLKCQICLFYSVQILLLLLHAMEQDSHGYQSPTTFNLIQSCSVMHGLWFPSIYFSFSDHISIFFFYYTGSPQRIEQALGYCIFSEI